MNLDKNTMELISTLEYIIGSQWIGPNTIKGGKGNKDRRFRFPVSYRINKKDKDFIKEKEELKGLSLKQIQTLEYVFGSHQLFIGDGLLGVLKELEDRYGIDFNELEKERTKKRKLAMAQLQKALKKNSSEEIYAGKYECGIDIAEGVYIITSDETGEIAINRSEKSKKKNKEFKLECNSKERIVLENGDILKSNVMLLIKQSNR